jgi:hypothetical protein
MCNVCLFLWFNVAPFYSEAKHVKWKWIAKEHTKHFFVISYTFESKTGCCVSKRAQINELKRYVELKNSL